MLNGFFNHTFHHTEVMFRLKSVMAQEWDKKLWAVFPFMALLADHSE